MLRAKYVNHIWLTDSTEIRGFLGLFVFKVVAVLDLFSRFPLAFGVFCREPSSEDVLQVLDRAMRKHGRPRHFVSDQGAQLTAEVFRETLDALGIRQRFGAVGQYGSIAIVERFWRTLKELLGVCLWPPFSKEHLEHRVELALAYYASLRPHQGLAGATPAEVVSFRQACMTQLRRRATVMSREVRERRTAYGTRTRGAAEASRGGTWSHRAVA